MRKRRASSKASTIVCWVVYRDSTITSAVSVIAAASCNDSSKALTSISPANHSRRSRFASARARFGRPTSLRRGAQRSAATDCHVVLDESEALHHAVRTMQRGEVVVVFYEKLEPVRAVLEKYAAQPVQSINGLNTNQAEIRARRVPRLARANGRRPPLQLAPARGSNSLARL